MLISCQPLTKDEPLKSHIPLSEVHEEVIKEIIYKWLNMYAITINHPECDFFPFLMDLTVAEIFYFLEVYKLKKAEKTSD